MQEKKESLDAEMKAKREEMARSQSEIERGLKDVKEQRDQLYRKLDLLKAQGCKRSTIQCCREFMGLRRDIISRHECIQ